jgi:Thiamine pyrophosphate enzyme, N-terminal TPP binding domain
MRSTDSRTGPLRTARPIRQCSSFTPLRWHRTCNSIVYLHRGRRSANGGDGGGRFVDTIHDWGVDVVFGMPGDGINGLMEALRTRQDRIRFVQVRHEESAALMACAYAKFTGKLAACLATSGPGGIHLLNGLYDAKLDAQPVWRSRACPITT